MQMWEMHMKYQSIINRCLWSPDRQDRKIVVKYVCYECDKLRVIICKLTRGRGRLKKGTSRRLESSADLLFSFKSSLPNFPPPSHLETDLSSCRIECHSGINRLLRHLEFCFIKVFVFSIFVYISNAFIHIYVHVPSDLFSTDKTKIWYQVTANSDLATNTCICMHSFTFIYMYSLLNLKCHFISISNLNLLGLFSTERGNKDLEN